LVTQAQILQETGAVGKGLAVAAARPGSWLAAAKRSLVRLAAEPASMP
jgi:hypothetical protein